MEKKLSIYPILMLIILSFKLFFMNAAMAQKRPIPIRVGVVLDMEQYVGEMGMNCISMAISDFYAKHGHYKTRLSLITKDSNESVVGAAAAALDLLKNFEVQAIIGPLSSVQANFIISLGDEAQVPIITFSATSPSLSSIRSQYFIRATLNDSSQVHAISAIVQAFGWREVVTICVDNEFGEGIIPFLTDALENVNARVPYRSVIPPLATDDQIVAELYKLMTMQTRVFVVHMLRPLGSRLFTKAKELGMLSEGYAWIVTNAMTNALNLMDPSVIKSMLGVIGVRSYIPETNELDDFEIRYNKRMLLNNPPAASRPDLNIYGLWAYDATVSLAMAVEKAILTNVRFNKAHISRNATDLEAFGVSNGGPKLIQALSSTIFKGLAGDFHLVDGQLQAPPYQIVNVVGLGARAVGYWTNENGIVKELNLTSTNTSTYFTSKSNLGSIIWPGDTTTPPKGWVIPTNGRKLRVGVPIKNGFNEFLRVTWNPDNETKVEGYCIDVFDAVMAALPYGVQYEYIPFEKLNHDAAGSYDELAYQVYLGNYDAVVGDVTIRGNRSKYVDFTLPFTESGVSMVVPIIEYYQKKNAWIFFKPLAKELWLTIFCSFVFIGFLIWILEHRINEDFRGSPWHQVGLIFWFAFSTMVFAQKEKVVSNMARSVLIIWFFVVLILTQSYTASLTSRLTIQQLHPTITDVNVLIKNKEYVGYQKGSFVLGLLKKMNFDESRLLTYNSPEEMNELFSKGAGNGGISAAFDEIPYTKLFLAKYCSNYTTIDPTYKADGFGFAFPIGSPLVPDVSRAILNVTEGEKMVQIENTWFRDNTKCPDSSTLLSNSLGLESFWGLFLMVGIPAVLAFIYYVITFLYRNWDVVRGANPNASIWNTIVGLLRRFDERDPNAPDFLNNNGLRGRGNDRDGAGMEREMGVMGRHENAQPPNQPEEPPQALNQNH